MSGFQQKKVLVTGATGGIGGAIAQKLFDAGATVAISGSRQEKLEALNSEKFDGKAVPIACDLSNLDNVEALVKTATEKLGGLDILVCNAGVTKDNLAMRMKDEEWQHVIDINLTASFKMARTSLRGMMKQRFGRIIFITSVVGWGGNPGQMNYCASKAGLTGMSKSLAQEVATRGITVNCIAPGFIATPMTDVLTEDQKERINQGIAMGRMGTPDDIASGVLYLASDDAGYMTGQTLHINGGMLMV